MARVELVQTHGRGRGGVKRGLVEIEEKIGGSRKAGKGEIVKGSDIGTVVKIGTAIEGQESGT